MQFHPMKYQGERIPLHPCLLNGQIAKRMPPIYSRLSRTTRVRSKCGADMAGRVRIRAHGKEPRDVEQV